MMPPDSRPPRVRVPSSLIMAPLIRAISLAASASSASDADTDLPADASAGAMDDVMVAEAEPAAEEADMAGAGFDVSPLASAARFRRSAFYVLLPHEAETRTRPIRRAAALVYPSSARH